MTVPPGWQPDPAGSSRLRWWDGNQWTDRLMDPPNQPAQQAPLSWDAQTTTRVPERHTSPASPPVQGPQPNQGQVFPVASNSPGEIEPAKGKTTVRNMLWIAAAVAMLAAVAVLVFNFILIPQQLAQTESAIAQAQADEEAAKDDRVAAEEELAALETVLEEIE